MVKKDISELKKNNSIHITASHLISGFIHCFKKRINKAYLILDILIYFGVIKKDQESVSAGLDPRVQTMQTDSL